MKKMFRHIRYRVCRTIYYADQCPKDCRKNYGELAMMVLQGALFSIIGFIAMFICVLMSI